MKFKSSLSGFTLIEIIIAMTILSLILILLFSTIFTANKSWQATEKKISENNNLRLVSYFLQKVLSQHTPLLWVDNKEQAFIFNGTNNDLRFTSTLPAHRGGGGVQVISIYTNKKDNELDLNLSYQQASQDNSPFGDGNSSKQITLLENIQGIELAYFGQKNTNEKPVWRKNWNNNVFLPKLISLKIRTTNNVQHWPEIVIPIYADSVRSQPQFILKANK